MILNSYNNIGIITYIYVCTYRYIWLDNSYMNGFDLFDIVDLTSKFAMFSLISFQWTSDIMWPMFSLWIKMKRKNKTLENV